MAARLDRALAGLKANPFAGGDVKRLRGRPGSFRLRVGELRVLFERGCQGRGGGGDHSKGAGLPVRERGG